MNQHNPSIFDSREFNQNLFFPREDFSPTPVGAEDHFITVEPGVKVHARSYPAPVACLGLLYFHGNGEIVADYNNIAEFYAALGAELTVCDYRGYGQSDGSPSLRTVLADAHVVFNYFKDKLKVPTVVMGRSLGSAPAIELCAHHQGIAALVIESGYADPIPLVERRGLVVSHITPEESALFNNSQKIAKVTCPTLVMHGEDDFLISAQEAQLNYEQAGSQKKYLEILEGVGHNDMMMAADGGYFSSLMQFFQKIP